VGRCSHSEAEISHRSLKTLWWATVSMSAEKVTVRAATVVAHGPTHSTTTVGNDPTHYTPERLVLMLVPEEGLEPTRGTPPAVFETGCPGKPYLLEPDASVNGGKTAGNPVVQQVDAPSQFRVFVYILPKPELPRIFGDTSIRRAPQEMFCAGDSRTAATTSRYLSPCEVHDAQFLSVELAKAIGLKLAVPLDPGSPRPDDG